MKKYLHGWFLIIALALSASPVFAEELAPNTEPAPEPIPKVHIFIRSGESVVFDGDFDLPEAGTKSVTDQDGTNHDINTQSVLGVLTALDEVNSDFSITNLTYYSSFGAFYLKCITAQAEFCDNWQYVVDGKTLWEGIDALNLSDGQSLAFYFGSSHRVNLSTNTFYTDEHILASAQKYNYLTDTWEVLQNVNLGLTQANPDDPWTPIVVAEKLVDTDGNVDFDPVAIGEYKIGIKEDYYFPSEDISVIDRPVISSGGGGGSGGAPIVVHNVLNVPRAISFLNTLQKDDGSYGEDLYTDWVAIALSKAPNADLTKLKNFLLSDTLDSMMLTDYERRAMALSALDISPYDGTQINYIKKIDESFDGNQFGDANLYNDDVFALIVLEHAGQDLSLEKYQQTVNFILSKQKDNGSFDGIDLTGAVIVALSKFSNIDKVNTAISKAKTYLQANQNMDGGWENSFATSWVLYALKDMSENPNLWEKNNRNPNDYLYNAQQADGGLESVDKPTQLRLWATAYAIPGALNLSWHDILGNFKAPAVLANSQSDSQELNTSKKSDLPKEEVELFMPKNIDAPVAEPMPKENTATEIPKPKKLLVASKNKAIPPTAPTSQVEKTNSSVPLNEPIPETAKVSSAPVSNKGYYFFGAMALIIISFFTFKFLKK